MKISLALLFSVVALEAVQSAFTSIASDDSDDFSFWVDQDSSEHNNDNDTTEIKSRGCDNDSTCGGSDVLAGTPDVPGAGFKPSTSTHPVCLSSICSPDAIRLKGRHSGMNSNEFTEIRTIGVDDVSAVGISFCWRFFVENFDSGDEMILESRFCDSTAPSTTCGLTVDGDWGAWAEVATWTSFTSSGLDNDQEYTWCTDRNEVFSATDDTVQFRISIVSNTKQNAKKRLFILWTDISTAPSTAAPSTSPTTAAPSVSPTKAPTDAPSVSPTKAPTDAPTKAPTDAPTKTGITASPTGAPTDAPTKAPTDAPTKAPTDAPTKAPTDAPTVASCVGSADGTFNYVRNNGDINNRDCDWLTRQGRAAVYCTATNVIGPEGGDNTNPADPPFIYQACPCECLAESGCSSSCP